MPFKIRMLLIAVKVIFFPFVIMNLLWRFGKNMSLRLRGKTTLDNRIGMTLYRKSDAGIEFVHVVEFEDKILEQRGRVGVETPRTFVPLAERDAVIGRIEDLLDEGFIDSEHFEDFDYIEIASPVEADFADGQEFDIRNALWDALDEFLADTGLGSVVGASSGSGTMELEIQTVDADAASDAITAFLNRTNVEGFKLEAEADTIVPAE